VKPAQSARYEASDAAPRPVVLAGFVLALVLGLAMAASAWISQGMVESEHARHAQVPGAGPALRATHATPALQSQPARELRAHRAWEEEQLHGAAWIDPVNRVVRIPIERALEKSLEEGFPVRPVERGAK
jgi:hypothetical protein